MWASLESACSMDQQSSSSSYSTVACLYNNQIGEVNTGSSSRRATIDTVSSLRTRELVHVWKGVVCSNSSNITETVTYNGKGVSHVIQYCNETLASYAAREEDTVRRGL